jgi:hypothetical protein
MQRKYEIDREIKILPGRNASDGQMGESAVWELLKRLQPCRNAQSK